jgi:hypothetical protein
MRTSFGLGAVRLIAPVVALAPVISVVPARGFTLQLTDLFVPFDHTVGTPEPTKVLTAPARQCRSESPNR